MPRYYFDWQDDTRLMRDEDGLDLPGMEAARREAASGLPDLAKDVLLSTDNMRELSITVRDGDGEPIFTTSIVFEMKGLGRRHLASSG